MALALGSMGMSYADFARLTPDEFELVYRQWHTTHVREPWEMARFMACCTLQPYSKRALKARDVCHFAWDGEDTETAAGHARHEESTRQRWEEMRARCG